MMEISHRFSGINPHLAWEPIKAESWRIVPNHSAPEAE
jgi:hypothetical protein